MNPVTLWSRRIVLAALYIIPFLSLFPLPAPFASLPLLDFSNGFYFPFITGKNFAFRMLVEVAVAAYVVLALVEPRYRPRFSWVGASYLALVVWMVIADAFAVNAHKAFWSNFERMDGWVTLVHVFAFFVIAGAVLTADGLWRRWWIVFLSGAALVSLYALFQLAGWTPIHQGSTRIDASLGNSAYLAVYLIFSCAVAVWQGIETPKGWFRYALFVFAAIEAFLVYETQTRGAVLGLIGGAIVTLALWAWEAREKANKTVRAWAIAAIVVIVVVAGGLWLARNSSFVQHDATLQRVTSIGTSDLAVRGHIWSMALQGAAARPITGWGQEGFNYVFNQYYQPALYGQEAWFDRAHNTFLDWLVAGGIPAFVFFVAMLVTAVLALYRRNTSRAERVLLIGALVAYAIQALVVFDNLFSYIPLAAVLAIAHGGAARDWKLMARIPKLTSEQGSIFAAPIAAVLGILALWFVNVPNVEAAHGIIAALSSQDVPSAIAQFKQDIALGSFADQEIREQIVQFEAQVLGSSAVSDADKQAVATYAIQEMQQQVQETPKDARLWLELALAYRSAGDLPDARQASAQAQALSPNKQLIYVEQGSEALAAQDFPAAQQLLNKAYQLDTSKTDMAAYAAVGDIFANDQKDADAILISAFGTTTPDNDLLVYAYYAKKDFARVIAIWKQRTAANDTLENDFNLAALYLQMGDKASARAEVQHAIQNNPSAAAQGQAFLQQIANTK